MTDLDDIKTMDTEELVVLLGQLSAQLNKAGDHPMTKRPTVGFDATATIKRSEFGMKTYVPAISDDVKLVVSIEAIDAQ